MLRIAPSGPPPPPAGPDPTAPPMPPTGGGSPMMLPMAPDPKAGGKYDAEKVKPETAGYLSPDEGPFLCARCHHYLGDSCEIVAGPIDPEGVCCLFEAGPGGPDVQSQDEPDENVPTDGPVGPAGAPPQGLNPLG